MRIAVIADIHGNLPALEAIFADIRCREVDRTINLGDYVSGPLWPREVCDLDVRAAGEEQQAEDAGIRVQVGVSDTSYSTRGSIHGTDAEHGVIKLIADSEAAATVDEQTEKLKQANKLISEDKASDWLYLYPQIVVAKADLSGYPVNGLNSQFFVYDIKKAD